MKDFEFLPHTADIKVRVYGKTKEKLFRNALEGMFQAIEPISSQCLRQSGRLVCKELPEKHKVVVDSPDINALLVDFLSEALYLSDVYNEAYLEAKIGSLSDTEIKAEILGVKVEGFETVEIKAVTYHDLNIEKIEGVWQTDIVFDI